MGRRSYSVKQATGYRHLSSALVGGPLTPRLPEPGTSACAPPRRERAESAVLSEEALVTRAEPHYLRGGANLPLAAVTAWVALTGHRRVTAEPILTQGWGRAFRFLRAEGVLCPEFGRRGSRELHEEKVRRGAGPLGASEGINYQRRRIADEERRGRVTDGAGRLCSIEEIGGPGNGCKIVKETGPVADMQF